MTSAIAPIAFDNSYARLPGTFYERITPKPVRAPRLIKLNERLALELGLDPLRLSSPEGLAILSGNAVADGAEPIAQAYAGHQFGGFVPRLGDGRACLLGEIIDPTGKRWDLQLKGSGPTPFSRNGDGRAALGPVLREYIVSEAMTALGIPSTRALAAVLSGEALMREDVLPGAILTRVASSHIRVGTFQFFAARDDQESLRQLVEYVAHRHDPRALDDDNPARALLEGIVARQARLIALWMGVGFIHGVMNTDNMTVSGETIDYGPCAFMDTFDPGQVYSSIDRNGRYAYGNQPRIAQWNLARLAETVLPQLAQTESAAVEIANAIVAGFSKAFETEMLTVLRAKLGLAKEEPEDGALANGFLKAMAEGGADFTNAWRGLAQAAAGPSEELELRLAFSDSAALDAWLPSWRARTAREESAPEARAQAMQRTNPAIIPRNHRIEAVIKAAVEDDNFEPFEQLVAVTHSPFSLSQEQGEYARPPQPDERVSRTFCGT